MQDRASWLEWRAVEVGGRPVAYGEAGTGPPVVFLHGWGLDHRAYKSALNRLVSAGMHVVAPALPGCGGSHPIEDERTTIDGLADWLAELVERLDLEPVVVVGHSFGGALAIAFAHRHRQSVRALVLVNSLGASAWAHRGGVLRSMADRPLWDWGVHLPADLWPLRQVRRVLPVVVTEAGGNLLRNPAAFWKMARVARGADLTQELSDLRDWGLPVVVLWGERDRLVTRHTFEETCRLLGDPPSVTVEGSHAWLIADPDAFGEVMTNVAGVIGLFERKRQRALGHRHRRPVERASR
ncbi:MAG TPA: alpha/beta fold hydrolase [Acidimicrobiales bacterium]|nr:alpha/beta fold hydrolase [Acidimicrobiales bacterium]